jgi:hypothetical protein
MKPGTIVKKVDKKDVRLGVHWNNKWINFCTLDLKRDNSLIFISKFHQEGNLGFGTSNLAKNNFINHQQTDYHEIKNGCHISLHPKKQVMHFKESSTGKILFERKMNWFPVIKPLKLLYLYSPPLDLCDESDKSTQFFTPIPNNYKDSIQVKVDIFPKNTMEHYVPRTAAWIFWGSNTEYLVRVIFNLIGQRVTSRIYWPN